MTAGEPERVERRLTEILAADVVGYSRLMGADEEGTVAALKAIRRELVDSRIVEHRGRIVKTTGDGLLVEFGSVVDAVRCAVDVQREMAARNADVPAATRIEFRVGINLGDIIVDGDDIFGDGVNVAARLETLAEPGGICVSRVVRDQVRDKLAFAFEDMGEQQVKNIARPVRAYSLQVGVPAGAKLVTEAKPQEPKKRSAPPALAVGIAALLVVITAGHYTSSPRRDPPPFLLEPRPLPSRRASRQTRSIIPSSCCPLRTSRMIQARIILPMASPRTSPPICRASPTAS
jgi:class 3 adenylate cyclase